MISSRPRSKRRRRPGRQRAGGVKRDNSSGHNSAPSGIASPRTGVAVLLTPPIPGGHPLHKLDDVIVARMTVPHRIVRQSGRARQRLGGRLGALIGGLPPPATLALAWCGEHAPVSLATEPGMKAVACIDDPEKSAKDEHCSDSDDCEEGKGDGSVEYP